MCDMSKLTWHEIEAQQTGTKTRHRKHHSQEVDSLCDDAKENFRKRKLGESFGDEMFRFRLEAPLGLPRWASFEVIWWDPAHQVYEQDSN